MVSFSYYFFAARKYDPSGTLTSNVPPRGRGTRACTCLGFDGEQTQVLIDKIPRLGAELVPTGEFPTVDGSSVDERERSKGDKESDGRG